MRCIIPDRKISFSIIAILFLLLVVFAIRNTKSSYAADQVYTKEQLQDFVISTALSYWYNQSYADYSQSGLDSSQVAPIVGKNINGTVPKTISFRDPHFSPEEISGANYFHIDCSSFVGMTYLHSLGYDFSNHYNHGTNVYYLEQGVYKHIMDNKDYFKYGNKYAGRGMSTTQYLKTGMDLYGDTLKNQNPYVNNNSSNNIVIMYWNNQNELTLQNGETKEQAIARIKNQILDILEPGDIVVYNAGPIGASADSSHAVLYVGDAVHSSKGIIHGTGKDFELASDNSVISMGRDSSIIYNDTSVFLNRLLLKNTETNHENKSFVILRPINEYCTSSSNCVININTLCGSNEKCIRDLNNLPARSELKNLQKIQYVDENVTYNINGTDATQEKYLSTYNSVNAGDTIRYNLLLKNVSTIGFCPSSNNIAKSTCDSYDSNGNLVRAWTNADRDIITYQNLVVSATIPDNTTFVSYNWNDGRCSYDDSTRRVTCNIAKIGNTGKIYIRYTVRVNDDATGNIVSNGMTITSPSGNKLTMGKIVTKINPTINDINVKTLKSNLDKFEQLASSGKITYTENAGNYKQSFDSLSSMSINSLDYPKSIYYNELGIDLSFLNEENIKNAFFNQLDTIRIERSGNVYNVSNYYSKKTEAEVAGLNNTLKTINSMAVKGLYGGYNLHGNDNLDRVKYLRVQDLEYGDILYTFSKGKLNAYIFCGHEDYGRNSKVQLKHFGSNGVQTDYVSAADSILLHSLFKDLFVIIRPSQYYGTTVRLNYNNAVESSKNGNGFVANSIYRIIDEIIPQGEPYVITYNYNKIVDSSYPKSESCANTFNSWHTNPSLTNKVTSSSSLASQNTHTLYAKYTTSPTSLPNPQLEGYTLEGWYTNSNLSSKAGNPSTSYTPKGNEKLYAKWVANEYTITFDSLGGTSVSPIKQQYDTNIVQPQDPTKEGYDFSGWYEDRECTELYTFNKMEAENKTLYAKWVSGENIITYILNGGINNKSNPSSYITGSEIVLNNPTYKGYDFIGWYTDESLTNQITRISATDVGNKNLYAKWKIINYPINMDNGGGISNNPSSYTINSDNIIINNPTREGYNFSGWVVGDNNNEILPNVTIEKGSIGTINLKAVWDIKSYVITYDLNHGDDVEQTESVNYNSSPSSMIDINRHGYNFIGWIANENVELVNGQVLEAGSTIENIHLIRVKKDITLSPKYELRQYNISLNSEIGGTIKSSKAYNAAFGSYIEMPIVEPEEGYEFDYWSSDKDVSYISKITSVNESSDSDEELDEVDVIYDIGVINAGQPINNDKMTSIIVNQDMSFVAHFKQQPKEEQKEEEDNIEEQKNKEEEKKPVVQSRPQTPSTVDKIIFYILLSCSSLIISLLVYSFIKRL